MTSYKKASLKKNARKSLIPAGWEIIYLAIGIIGTVMVCKYYVQTSGGVWPDVAFLTFTFDNIEKFGSGGAITIFIVFMRQLFRGGRDD